NLVLRLANPLKGGELSVAAARGGFLSGVELYGIRVRRDDGTLDVKADTLAVRYRLLELIQPTLRVRSISVSGLHLMARLPLKSEPAPKQIGGGGNLALDRVELKRGSGAFHVRSAGRDSVLELSDVALAGAVRVTKTVAFTLDTLTAVLRAPAPPAATVRLAASAEMASGRFQLHSLQVIGDRTRVSGAGTIVLPDSVRPGFDGTELHLTFAPLAGGDIERFLPALGNPGDVTLDLAAHGVTSSLHTTLAAKAERGGSVSLDAVLPARAGTMSLRSNGRLQSVDLGALMGKEPGELVITGSWTTDLAGPDRSRISGPLSLDFAGTRIQGVHLDRAKISGRFDEGRLTCRLGGEAARFALEGSGSVSPFSAPVAYDFSGDLSVPPIHTKDKGPVLFAGVVPIRVRGRTAPAGASLTANAELEPDVSASPLIGPGTLSAALDSNQVSFSAEITAASGIVRAEGGVGLGQVPTFRIRDGSIRRVDLARFNGDTTRCEISGLVRAEGKGSQLASMRATAQVESLVVRYGQHEVRDGQLALALENGRARIDAKAKADGGPVDARVTVASLAPLDRVQAGLTFRDVDLALLAAGKAPKSLLAGSLNADLHGDALRVDGRLECRSDEANLAGTIAVRASRFKPTHSTAENASQSSGHVTDSLQVDANLDFSGSRFRRVTLDRALGKAHLSHGRLDAAVRLRAGPDSATVIVDGTPFADPMEVHASGAVSSDRIGEMVGTDSLRAAARLTFEAGGEVPRSDALRGARLSARLAGNARAAMGTAGDARFDSILVDGSMDHGVADFQRVTLRGNLLRADGAGRIALLDTTSTDSTSFQLNGSLGELEPLARLLKLSNLSILQGTFGVAASGSGRATTLTGHARLIRPHVNEIWADSVALDVTSQARGTSMASLGATVTARSLVVWPLTSRDLTAVLGWDGREATANVRSLLPGNRPEEIVVRIEPREGGVRGRLERFLHTSLQGPVELQKPVDFEFGKRWHLSDLILTDQGAPLLQARGDVGNDSVDIEVHVHSASLDRFHEELMAFPLKGTLSVDGTLKGTMDRPIADATLQGKLVSGDRKPSDLASRLHWADGVLDLSAKFDQTEDSRLSVDSKLPVALAFAPATGMPQVAPTEGSMDAKIGAENLDLSWFESLVSPRQARDLKGWLDGEIAAAGDPDIPNLSGSLTLKDAGVELPALGIKLKDGGALLTLRDRTARLESASIKSGGSITASGEAMFEGPGRRPMNLELKLNRFVPVNTSQAKAKLDGRITITGDIGKPRIHADLTVDKSTIYAEKGEGSNLEPVELTSRDRLDLQERFGVGVGANQASQSAGIDSVDLDVTVKLGENVWVRRHSDPIVALELKGDVRVQKPAGQPVNARGSLGIKTGRSYLSFLGRRFDMRSVNVELPGPIDSASARLEAFYHPRSNSGSDDVDVTAIVEIDPAGIKTTLRSEPYLDQASLLNYLATGKVQGGLESGSAYGLAVGSALGTVGGSAGRKLGIDVVEVTTDAYGGQTLGAGSYVNPRVYLGFRQPVVEGKRSGNSS
ncbi:MAG TPA: translocation/assembly module TamB domain-containing protein, partial [Candidatus Nitrosocosmicus sp.]|nr:translocation/assembly module TamB domain-containing protein [Candidatus Nitrosocosmicus sp.]